jgi:predicted ATP-grasp superfamily ATP-dependent carboligase
MDVTTPVLVLESSRHGGIMAARSLGRLGIPVYGADRDSQASLFSSKYCRGGFILDFSCADRERSVEDLANIGHKIGRQPILIPTSDSAALFIAKHADVLREAFIFPLMHSNLVQSLCNKKEMFFLAKSFGVPTPDTFFPASRNDVLQYAEHARFPMIIKPIETTRGTLRSFKKAVVNSPEALITQYDLTGSSNAPNVMLQEFIPGEEDANWMFNGYFDAKACCEFGGTGRKIRQYPPYAGVTSLGICKHNPTVMETTIRFMAAIGYQGILDIGYRYDARDDLYKVFDVNPRLGCTFRLFVSDSGMDVARALYLDLTGQRICTGCITDGRRWAVEDLDLLSSFHYWRHGKVSVRDWVSSVAGLDETALFARDDLKPIVRILMRNFQHWVWKFRNRANTASPQSSCSAYRGSQEREATID